MSDESLQNYIALVVDDHDAVRHALCERIRASFARFELREAGSVDEALKIVDAERVDIVLMDIRLPGMDGFEVLRRLRAAGSKAPVLVLTARDDEVDKVIGLELGADDYLTKPFGLRELMSRIKALLRRAYGDLSDAAGGRVIRHGDLVIDLERRRVQRGDRRIGRGGVGAHAQAGQAARMGCHQDVAQDAVGAGRLSAISLSAISDQSNQRDH